MTGYFKVFVTTLLAASSPLGFRCRRRLFSADLSEATTEAGSSPATVASLAVSAAVAAAFGPAAGSEDAPGDWSAGNNGGCARELLYPATRSLHRRCDRQNSSREPWHSTPLSHHSAASIPLVISKEPL